MKTIIKEGNQLLLDRQFHRYDDYDTWYEFFEKFRQLPKEKNNQMLKLIFARRIVRTRHEYCLTEGETVSLAKICGDICPVWKTPLDYGSGQNKLINSQNPETPHHSFYQPSIDHRIPKSYCKKYGGPLDYDPDQLENYVIISEAANTAKNRYFHSEEELDAFYKGMKETYFTK